MLSSTSILCKFSIALACSSICILKHFDKSKRKRIKAKDMELVMTFYAKKLHIAGHNVFSVEEENVREKNKIVSCISLSMKCKNFI